MQQRKKIAFFGTPAFTTRFLNMLTEAGYAPTIIVTAPDRPAGRGMKLTAPGPKRWGEERGIRVLQPEKLDDDFYTELSKEHWDLFIVIAYGKIFPERFISLPAHGTINVHYSLLPKYRGATPVESAILHGDTSTGVSIQAMRSRLDSGPILAAKEVPIDSTDTTPSLREKLNDEALQLLPGVIENIFSGNTRAREQDEAAATYCTKISKEDGEISLSDDPLILDRKLRAYQPWPGLFFYAEKGGKRIRVKIKAAHLEEGRLVLDTVIPENGKPLSASSFQQFLRS